MANILYRDITSHKYVTLEQAKAAHPQVSFGNRLTDADYVKLNVQVVYATPRPSAPQIYDYVREVEPTLTNGKLYQTWEVVDPTVGATPEQLAGIKQNLAVTLSKKFDSKRDSLVLAGFRYDFSAYSTVASDVAASVSCATLNPTGLGNGILTLQMDGDSLTKWLGIVQIASLELQAGSTTPIQIRVKENYNISLPPLAAVTILRAAGMWVSLVTIGVCAALKDKVRQYATDPTKTPADMTALTWPDAQTNTPLPV